MTGRPFLAAVATALLVALAPAGAAANTPPTATITSPSDATKFTCSGSYLLAGTAGDAESSSSQLTKEWKLELYYEGAVVKTMAFADYYEPLFKPCYRAPSYWRIEYTVTDPEGASTTDVEIMEAATRNLTLSSNLPAAQLYYHGDPVPTPYTQAETQNYKVPISADERVTSNGVVYGFGEWTTFTGHPWGGSPSTTTQVSSTSDRVVTAYYFPVPVVDVASRNLRFRDTGGWYDHVKVEHVSGELVVTDTMQLAAGPGCTQDGLRAVRCPESAVDALDFDLGAGDDTATLSPTLPAKVLGGLGNDTVHAGSAADNIDGGSHDDTLNGNGGSDTVVGGYGNDTLSGGAGVNTLKGGAHDDKFVSAPGAKDDLAGGDNLDSVSYANRTSSVTVRPDGVANDGEAGEADNVRSDVEWVSGSPYADTLIAATPASATAYHGPRRLEGNGGDDYLQPSTVPDIIFGGAGFDRVSYHMRTTGIIARPESPYFTTGSSGAPDEHDRLATDIEHFRGGSGNDTIYANSAINGMIIEGMAGDDTLHPSRSFQADVRGGDGSDTVSYDDILGEPVNVTLDDAANDGPGGKFQHVGIGIENIVGGHEHDTLVGNNGPNRINGSIGDDYLDGRLGKDELIGWSGTDRVTYQFRTAAVVVSLDGQANDGHPGEGDNVRADVETVRGSPYADTLTGNGSANKLQGMAGNDTIDPLAGSDVVEGNDGNDTVTLVDGVFDTLLCGAGTDTVTRDAMDSVSACEAVSSSGGGAS